MGDANPRITPATQAVLRALIEDPTAEHYGRQLSASTGLPSGRLHPILARLELLDWVDSGWEAVDPRTVGRPRRRYYHVNERGLSLARACLAEAYARRSRAIGRLRPIGETS
jgi:PadR family transcriptional regulator, regulatory protein PadR